MYFQAKLHNNSILTGSVDSYCLVCDSYLRSEDEAFTHTEKPIHKKNMATCNRLDRFLDDHIIKVKKGYYCTFCNILLTTIAKVNLHIGNINHQENKGAQMLSRIGDYVIAFNEVAISSQHWHGLTEGTCVICNVEFEKEDVHRSDQNHILKLIQSKCEFGDNYIYRKVDEESFFCLICGGVFAMSDKLEHSEDFKHQVLYNYGKEIKKKHLSAPELKAKKTKILPKPKQDNSAKNLKDSMKTPILENDNVGVKSEDADNESSSQTAETSKTEGIDVKNTEITKSEHTETAIKNNEEVDTKKAKGESKDTQEFAGACCIEVAKVDDFIDSASKVINTEEPDPNMSEYLEVNNYIVRTESFEMKCVLCDVMYIKEEELKEHLTKDLHHQMMLKKHRETLYKKKNGPQAETNEIFRVDNLVVSRGKIYLENPENETNNSGPRLPAITNTKSDQINLEIASPVDIQSKIRKRNPDSDISSDEEEEYKTKILENVDKFQQNDITIDMFTEKAYCKQCNKEVTFDFDALERHINEQHKKEDRVFIKPEINTKTQIVTYARENYIVLMQNEAYCKLCNTTLFISMESFIEHVSLNTHKEKVIGKNGTGPVKKMQASDFMQTFFRVESNLGADIIVNNKHVLRHYSFHCVILDGEIYKCTLCEIDFPKENEEDLAQHLNTIEHKTKMGICNVVITLTEEFIREITPGKYHCGYCNKVFNRWPAIQDHILHSLHLQARRHARWNLERCHTLMRNARSMQIGSRSYSAYNHPDVLRSPPPLPQVEQPRPSYQYFVMLQELRASNRRTHDEEEEEDDEPERPSAQVA